MARTRTQAGVITQKNYKYETTRLRGEKSSTSAKKSGRTGRIEKGKKKGGNRKKAERSRSTTEEQPALNPTDVDHEPTPQPEPDRRGITDGNHWWPSAVIGEKEEKGLR